MPKKSAIELAAPSAITRAMFYIDPYELVVVGYDTKDGPEHPLYDPRVKQLPRPGDKLNEKDAAMVMSIKRYGIRQPVEPRKDGDKIQCVFGRRRTILCRFASDENVAAGLPPVKLPVLADAKVDDADAFGHIVIENEQRQDDTAEVRAYKVKRMVDQGKGNEEIAWHFNKSKANAGRFIAETLAYFDLDREAQVALNTGVLQQQTAVELAKKPREAQRAVIAEAKAAHTAAGKTPRVTTQDVRNADRRAAGNDDLIPRSIWKKVVDLPGAKELEKVDPVKMMKVMLGQLPLSQIAGLTALVKEAAGPRRGEK